MMSARIMDQVDEHVGSGKSDAAADAAVVVALAEDLLLHSGEAWTTDHVAKMLLHWKMRPKHIPVITCACSTPDLIQTSGRR